jgi:hypothetical protein
MSCLAQLQPARYMRIVTASFLFSIVLVNKLCIVAAKQFFIFIVTAC